ncbi:MAG: DUF1549 domain-containing protein [Gemmataceae bacterium]
MAASFLVALTVALPAQAPAQPPADVAQVAARIDALTARYWQGAALKPAALCDDATFLRRIALDLAGRIPTYEEARAFAADSKANKRARAIARLMESSEYHLHLATVLDGIIQLDQAGDAEFIRYLRGALARRQAWDDIFRDVLLGPWDRPDQKGADRFLLKRLGKLDDLTNDTARVFFGVDVSCAKCHDHPLVPDWKQDHYYGMASFFNRTAKGKGKDQIAEKKAADVTFTTTKGEKRTAKLMFLSSKVIDPDEKKVERRRYLVETALEDKVFFRRALVNKLWDYFMGRGLVAPVDQMHAGNRPAVPELLEYLGEDFAAARFDLDRVVASIVSSRVYQLASVHPGEDRPRDSDFAMAQLRPLSPNQFALSIILATGEDPFASARNDEERGKRYLELEGRAGGLLSHRLFDERTERFQSSAGEALFVSNHADVQKLLVPAGKNLVARLADLKDDEAVELAVWSVLSRAPQAEEKTFLVKWLAGRKDRAKACGQLVWALMASAEFRFNH